MLDTELFQQLLLSWFEQNGRKHLPWQNPRTPYRVWISEIMLQQTQVATVIPYFEKFIQCFPDITLLATADEDTVLSLWSGLGYYARARNLHRTAKYVVENFKGQFPSDVSTLESLPGIGRSTAGAIVSLGFNRPAPILDGNVKRVFARLYAISDALDESKTIKRLWQLAEACASRKYPCNYTQAIMDFGSLVCTRRHPNCNQCPMQSSCLSFLQNKTNQYPVSKRSRAIPTRMTNVLILINEAQEILLEKRPPIGIWGGLWSLPECSLETVIQDWCLDNHHCLVRRVTQHSTIEHTFSHFKLIIHPIVCQVTQAHSIVNDQPNQRWCKRTDWTNKGVAAPIKKILTRLLDEQSI